MFLQLLKLRRAALQILLLLLLRLRHFRSPVPSPVRLLLLPPGLLLPLLRRRWQHHRLCTGVVVRQDGLLLPLPLAAS